MDKDGGGRKLIRILATAVLTFAGMPAAAQDCGPESPCEIDGGSYHLRLPEGEGPRSYPAREGAPRDDVAFMRSDLVPEPTLATCGDAVKVGLYNLKNMDLRRDVRSMM